MVFLVFFLFQIIVLFILSQLLTKALSRLFLRITKSQITTIHFLSIIFLPGVIIHELAHMLVASLLFVRVGEMEFMPKITEDRVKLGGIQIERTGPLRRALIGLAPVLFGGLILIISLLYAVDIFKIPFEMSPYIKWAIELYLLFEIGNTMFSSKKDVEGTLELLIVLAIVFFALYGVSLYVHSQIFAQAFGLFVNLITPQVGEAFKQIDTLLLIPLGLDVIILSVTKITEK